MISLAKLVDLRDKWRNYEPTQQECDMLADALSAALKVVEAYKKYEQLREDPEAEWFDVEKQRDLGKKALAPFQEPPRGGKGREEKK